MPPLYFYPHSCSFRSSHHRQSDPALVRRFLRRMEHLQRLLPDDVAPRLPLCHWLHEVRAGKQQAIVHTVMIAASLVALPSCPTLPGNRPDPRTPVAHPRVARRYHRPALFHAVFDQSFAAAWYARRNRGIPHRLFALSNLASMMALLTYPGLVEPNFTTRFQGEAWSAGYIVFAIACTFTAWHASASKADAPRSRIGQAAAVPEAVAAAPDRQTQLLWL